LGIQYEDDWRLDVFLEIGDLGDPRIIQLIDHFDWETAGETANPIFENIQVGLVLVWIMMSNMMTARFDQQ
jgi:hypothetical protein